MIIDEIRKILADYLETDEKSIKDDTGLYDDLALDSLEMIDIVMSLEDTFLVEIPDEALESIETVGDLSAYIESNTD